MLTTQEVRELSRTSDTRSVLAIGLDWAGVVAIFAVVAKWPSPMTYAAGVVLMARQQLALATLMHEAAHYRLFKDRWTNDFVGQLLTAVPVFLALEAYRSTHLHHHRSPLAADDPDLRLIGGYPVSKESLARKLLRDAFGVSYFKLALHFAKISFRRKNAGTAAAQPSNRRTQGARVGRVVLLIVVVQGTIFGALAYAGHPLFFVMLWILPFMTVMQVFLRIRALAEHAGFGPAEDQMANSRTVESFWQAAFVAPHNLNFHIEHHRYPSLPWFNLPRAHKLLKERGALRDRCVAATYGEVLATLVLPPRAPRDFQKVLGSE